MCLADLRHKVNYLEARRIETNPNGFIHDRKYAGIFMKRSIWCGIMILWCDFFDELNKCNKNRNLKEALITCANSRIFSILNIKLAIFSESQKIYPIRL